MDIRKTKLLFLTLFFLQFFSANASHIVGGVMNYKYLGNNNFEITLFVYRDDIRANPNAFLDNPAIIRVYNGSVETQFNFTLPFDSFLNSPLVDPCATIPITERIDWTKYRGIINLPPNNNGYTIYYQRCCRNNSILNITKDPVSGNIEWGATYTINIPPAVNGQHVNNTSPIFLNYPPVYICNNKPITYNHAATDADGDRLVYSLCVPFSGADVPDPTNTGGNGQTPNDEPPPFTNVQWRNPYSLANVLSGVPLTVNTSTGLLSGTPNTVGQFVVGVCVDEFRNGVRLTRTIRDFQFNVVDCGLKVISSFFAPNLQCNNFTINFTNNSFGATTYKWYFGDGDSSTLQNPSHTYAAAGNYNVVLVCNQNESCNATSTQTVVLRFKRIQADFIAQNIACIKRGDTIRFVDQSVDPVNINTWKWTFSNGTTSTIKNPFVIYDGTATSITATLTVNSSDSCSSSITKTIGILKEITTSLPDSLTSCVGGSITLPLTVSPTTNNTFSWSPATGLNSTTIQNPTATVNANTTYIVTVTNNQTCIKKDTIQVKIKTVNQDLIPDTLKFCKQQVRVLITRTVTNIQWSTNANFVPVISTSNPLVVSQTLPIVKYYVKATVDGCPAMDSIIVLFNDTVPTITAPDSITFCNIGDRIFMQIAVDKFDSLYWSTSTTFVPNFNNNTLSLATTASIKTYYIKAFYKGCFSVDSILIRQKPKPTIAISDSVLVCADSVRLIGLISNFDSLSWSFFPDFNPVFSHDANIVLSQTVPEKMYYLKVYYLGCETIDSFRVLYNDTLPSVDLSSQKIFCSDSVSAFAFVDFYTSVSWYDTRDLTHLIGTNLTLQITQPQGKKWYYFKADYKFCSTIDSIELENRSIKINPIDVAVCVGDSVTLKANVRTASQYDIIWISGNDTFETNNIDSIKIKPTASQSVFISVHNIYGCSADDSIVVSVNPTPAIDATVDKPVIFRGEQVQLTATQNQAYAYNWIPVNLVSNAAIFNPTSSPIQTTIYTVSVNDRNNCKNEDTVSVRVLDYTCDKSQIFIPSAFSPNGDGVNDVFLVRSTILKSSYLLIYDRWGNQVFETKDINAGWNGTYKNQVVQLETYGYYFEGECFQGEKITLKGNVTLVK